MYTVSIKVYIVSLVFTMLCNISIVMLSSMIYKILLLKKRVSNQLTNTVVTHATVGSPWWSKYFARKAKLKFDCLSIYCDLLNSWRRTVCLGILTWSFCRF